MKESDLKIIFERVLLSSESEMVISAFLGFLVKRDRMAQALRGALELNLSNHLTYFIVKGWIRGFSPQVLKTEKLARLHIGLSGQTLFLVS